MQLNSSLRILAESARKAALSEMKQPSLYSVLVHFEQKKSTLTPKQFQFGFHELQVRPLLGDKLKACWVDVSANAQSVAVSCSGTYGKEQFKQLASVQGFDFPPPTLELAELTLEPADVLQRIQQLPLIENQTPLGEINISLCRYEGHLAWRVLQNMPGVGMRTLFLHAGKGDVLFEKIDRESNA